MGFFNWIGEKLNNFKEYVTDKIEEVKDKIEDFLYNFSKETGKTDSYDKEKNYSLIQTANMSGILSGFSISLQTQADRIEQNCVIESQKYFDELVKLIESSKSGINSNRLKKTFNNVKRNIDGFLKNHLAKRVSLDDNECLNILKMSAGNEKEKAMKTFGKKVIDEALNTLSQQIADIVKEQNEEIEEFFKDVLEKREIELSTMQNQFNLIATQSENDVLNKEKAKILPLIYISVTDTVLSNFAE